MTHLGFPLGTLRRIMHLVVVWILSWSTEDLWTIWTHIIFHYNTIEVNSSVSLHILSTVTIYEFSEGRDEENN